MSEDSIYCSILTIGSRVTDLVLDLPLDKAGLDKVIYLVIDENKSPAWGKVDFLAFENDAKRQQEIEVSIEAFFHQAPFSLCCIDLDSPAGLQLLLTIGTILKDKVRSRRKLFILYHQNQILSPEAIEAVNNLNKLHDNIIILTGKNCEKKQTQYLLISFLAQQACSIQRQGDIGYVETLISTCLMGKIQGNYADDFHNLPQIMDQHPPMTLNHNESMIFFLLVGEDFTEEHQKSIEEGLLAKNWQLDRCFIEIIHMKDWLDSFILCELSASLFQCYCRKLDSFVVTQEKDQETPLTSPTTSVQDSLSLLLEDTNRNTEIENPPEEEASTLIESLDSPSITEKNIEPPEEPSDPQPEEPAPTTQPTKEPILVHCKDEEIPIISRSFAESHDGENQTTLRQTSENKKNEQTPKKRNIWKGLSHFFQVLSNDDDLEENDSNQVKNNKNTNLKPQQELDLIEYSRGIFEGNPINSWKGENLDIPTYLRQNILLFQDKEKKEKEKEAK